MPQSWLLRAAMERRARDLVESRGAELADDSGENGGALRHRAAEARRRELDALQCGLFDRLEEE